ncbi:hypothetical protein AU255_09205 [Methyloprofundus sedimenti]|uniref:Terminase small subunit n=1 Tax=Methyloprofundus sedimenti TaxID=1420851 RepID=A0A1V8M8X7_9GAMM|nr:hypothetical protein [Methyloprofundus sedimenti]OQK18015.1 hypothetical protein AU255_09205 [Methyloprofundus sedimenti]
MNTIETLLAHQVTRSELGRVISASRQTVDGLIKRGVVDSHAPLGEQLELYINHLREIAAGRATNCDLNLATERAGLAKEQRLRLEMQNAVARREYGPIIEMELGLADVLAMAGSKLDTIVGKLKKQSDILTADDLDIVGKIIADVRNDIADTVIDWFPAESDTDDNDDL